MNSTRYLYSTDEDFKVASEVTNCKTFEEVIEHLKEKGLKGEVYISEVYKRDMSGFINHDSLESLLYDVLYDRGIIDDSNIEWLTLKDKKTREKEFYEYINSCYKQVGFMSDAICVKL